MGRPPPPDPIPTIHFDHQRAQDAIDALLAAAKLLQQHTTTDLANARHATEGWDGHHADTFEMGDLPWITGEASRIVDGMLKLAGTIGSASACATTLQRQAAQQAHAGRGRTRPI